MPASASGKPPKTHNLQKALRVDTEEHRAESLPMCWAGAIQEGTLEEANTLKRVLVPKEARNSGQNQTRRPGDPQVHAEGPGSLWQPCACPCVVPSPSCITGLSSGATRRWDSICPVTLPFSAASPSMPAGLLSLCECQGSLAVEWH